MSEKRPDPNPADLEPFNVLQDALGAVLTFPKAVIVPDYMTINILHPIHDHSGKEIPAQLHFADKDGAMYVMTIEEKTETGLKFRLIPYNSTTGGAFTFSNLLGLVLADKTIAPLIDANAARDAINRMNEAVERENPEKKDHLTRAKDSELSLKNAGPGKSPRSIDLAKYNAAAVNYEQLSLFGAPFIPMMHGIPTDDLMGLSFKVAEPDPTNNGTAIIRVRNRGNPHGEYIVTIERYEKLQARLSTSACKLLDTAAAVLTQNNSYKAKLEDINPTVHIDLMEYARANGYKVDRQPVKTEAEAEQQERRIEENLKKIKQDIRRDLTDMKRISQTWEEVTGNNRGDYRDVGLVSSHGVSKGKIIINLDIEFARYIVSGYCMQYPPALLLHDNRNPSSYVIGRKLALHNSMLSNQERGTANTLSVKSLLDVAPAIPTIEELRERGRRDWKIQIKAKLEKALDDNMTVGYLVKWRYHDGATGNELTKEQADKLSWDAYYSLYVDFTTAEHPNLAKSLEARQEKRSKAALEGEREPKRRGRPRKAAK